VSDFKIEGLGPVLAKLKALGDPKRVKSAVRSANTKALRSVRDAARAGAKALDDPRSPEQISKNIVTKAGRSKDRNEVVTRVGVLGGARNMQKYGEFKGAQAGNPGGDTWYWRLLEFGTSQIAARPFMRPALQNNQGKVVITFTSELDKSIDKIVAKGKV
jgi:HK97 gp10 family phage protein